MDTCGRLKGAVHDGVSVPYGMPIDPDESQLYAMTLDDLFLNGETLIDYAWDGGGLTVESSARSIDFTDTADFHSTWAFIVLLSGGVAGQEYEPRLRVRTNVPYIGTRSIDRSFRVKCVSAL